MEIMKTYKAAELREFEKLVLSKWPNVEFPNEKEGDPITPKPILAKKNGFIVGGLSYLWHLDPTRDELALWINTVLVIPAYQKQGIGTALVQFAMQEQTSERALYVYTTIPNLYLKSAWSLVSVESENHVLRYVNKIP